MRTHRHCLQHPTPPWSEIVFFNVTPTRSSRLYSAVVTLVQVHLFYGHTWKAMSSPAPFFKLNMHSALPKIPRAGVVDWRLTRSSQHIWWYILQHLKIDTKRFVASSHPHPKPLRSVQTHLRSVQTYRTGTCMLSKYRDDKRDILNGEMCGTTMKTGKKTSRTKASRKASILQEDKLC